MRNRIKKLEDKKAINDFTIIYDAGDVYEIPSKVITELGYNPEDYKAKGVYRIVKASSSLVSKVLSTGDYKEIDFND